jgi:predicted alpha-1,2-mannosidase
MNKFFIIFSFIFCSSCQIESSHVSQIDYVDPMIGTAGAGHTFPGATTPFGMIQLSPSNDNWGRNWRSGYHHTDTLIKGFAHNHISGAGLGAFGDILMMPTCGKLITNPGKGDNPDKSYRSRFSHETEKSSPGYYSVVLEDYNIKVELTASPRVGYHRYTFNNAGENHIIIDPVHGLREFTKNTEIEFLSDTEIRGFKASTGVASKPEPRHVYFYAKFSKPFKQKGVVFDGKVFSSKLKATHKNTKGFITYNLDKGEQVIVAVALSYISYEGAKKNYDAEAIDKNFDNALKETQDVWKTKLSKFNITGTEIQKRIFYTAVYHSFIGPNLISDVDGNYVVEHTQLKSVIPQFSNFSTWDTYRATHPLFNLVEHTKNAEIVNSLASRFTQAKVSLPIWECGGHDTFCMIGRSPIAVMGEAILKGVKGIDIDDAYAAMYDAAFTKNGASRNYGNNNGMDSYLERSYVTADVGCSVSKTTEYNYHDYVMAQVAKKLGKKEDYEYFTKRSKGYLNLWNKDKMYLWPKTADGDWIEMRMDIWDELKDNYISGNIWAYSTYVPHDVDNLIDLVGGKAAFVTWLDKIFTDTTPIGGDQHTDISGFIGKLGFGDEPGHHTPYLFALAGAPYRTQELVRQISTTMFSDKPDGLINNEDLGQMSSWYIFSSLGFYPVSPASKEYVIGSPLHDEAIVKLDNGKTLKVIARNNSEENKYVKSVTFNGKKIKNFILPHAMIMGGGELVFQMSADY